MNDNDLIRRVAVSLWREEAVDVGAPKSIAELRTPEAFADQSDYIRTKWEKFARAAIRALSAEPAEDVRAALIKLLRVVYGMAGEGCDAPNAAYRWCERIDEIFHDPEAAYQYEDWAADLPSGILALIHEAKP